MSSITRVVAITGCDSGLGWAIAARSAREGLVTIAGMFQGTDTKAAAALRKLCAHPYSVDVTNPESIAGFRDYVDCLLKDNPNYKLHAVVNNAGVMTIGNFEWQTPGMVEDTINVNLLGAMRVASAFLPALRMSATQVALAAISISWLRTSLDSKLHEAVQLAGNRSHWRNIVRQKVIHGGGHEFQH